MSHQLHSTADSLQIRLARLDWWCQIANGSKSVIRFKILSLLFWLLSMKQNTLISEKSSWRSVWNWYNTVWHVNGDFHLQTLTQGHLEKDICLCFYFYHTICLKSMVFCKQQDAVKLIFMSLFCWILLVYFSSLMDFILIIENQFISPKSNVILLILITVVFRKNYSEKWNNWRILI